MQPQMPQQPMSPTPTPVYTPGMQPENPGKGMGIAGLICAFVFPLLGVILSAVGLSQSKKVGMSNGLALAGLITSIAFMVIGAIIGAFMLMGILFAASICSDPTSPSYSASTCESN